MGASAASVASFTFILITQVVLDSVSIPRRMSQFSLVCKLSLSLPDIRVKFQTLSELELNSVLEKYQRSAWYLVARAAFSFYAIVEKFSCWAISQVVSLKCDHDFLLPCLTMHLRIFMNFFCLSVKAKMRFLSLIASSRGNKLIIRTVY